MHERLHHNLSLAILFFIAVLSASLLMASFAYYQSSLLQSSERTFQVTGEGSATAIPDTAHFTFSTITEGNRALKELQEENNKISSQIIAELKERGVEEKDISTKSYTINPRYERVVCPSDRREPCPPPEIAGYAVHNTVEVKVKELERVGSFLSLVIDLGANQVSQVSFSVEDEDALRKQAREIAFEKAKKKAQEFAKAGGFRVGRLVSISESSSFPGPVPVFREESATDLEEVGIEPGSQEISVSLHLTYEIK